MQPCNAKPEGNFFSFSLSEDAQVGGWASREGAFTKLKIKIGNSGREIIYFVKETLENLAESSMVLRDNCVFWAALQSRNIYIVNIKNGFVETIPKVPGMPVSFLSEQYYFFPDNKSIISRNYADGNLKSYLLPENRGEILPFAGPVLFYRRLEEDLYFIVEGQTLQNRGRLPGLIKGGLLSDISFSMSGDKLTLTAPKRFGSEECLFEIDLNTLMHEKKIVSIDSNREKSLLDIHEGVKDLKKV